MASTRRLAAIFAADVAGYSRLMGVDEEGTHERLKAHFRQLIDPKIKEHQGRIVKNTGDGVLARGRAGRASLGGIAPQPVCAYGQRPGAACAEPIRGSHY